MQKVPHTTLVVGVEYRIHMKEDGDDGALDYLGVLKRKNVFTNGDVRYLFHHVVAPVPGAPHINGFVEHRRMPDIWTLSIDPATHTFFVTAKNMALKSIISKKTGRTVGRPSLTHYFGKKNAKRRTKKKRT